MARVTVEDCIDKVPNRFELVLLSSRRARADARRGVVDRLQPRYAVISDFGPSTRIHRALRLVIMNARAGARQ